MPVYDFGCSAGDEHLFEHRCSIADKPASIPCPVEGCELQATQKHIGVPAMPTTIIVDYPGSKRLKAGYVHSHGPKAATKTQFGYGGAVSPERKHLNPVADNVIPEAVKYSNARR